MCLPSSHFQDCWVSVRQNACSNTSTVLVADSCECSNLVGVVKSTYIYLVHTVTLLVVGSCESVQIWWVWSVYSLFILSYVTVQHAFRDSPIHRLSFCNLIGGTLSVSLEDNSLNPIYTYCLRQFPSRFLLNWLGNARRKHAQPICEPVCEPLPGGGLKPASMQFRCTHNACKR